MATESSTDTFNPFPGLRPFRQDEDYLFFGREEQVRELLGLLSSHRFLAVVGTSGSGKSSLVRCGLLSELQGGSMVEAGSRWDVAVMQPGGDPLRRLARALCEADLYESEDPSSVPQVLATLMRSRNGLVEAARQSEMEAGSNLLLVVDQFEEIFRFHEAGEKGLEQAPDFIRLLLTACEQTEVPVYVVLTMRSDFLGDCPQFAGLAEAVNEGEYLIPRLTREQSRSAIEGPARVAGGDISRRLVQRLLNDLGSETEQLPVLQHALMRTWDRWLGDHGEGEPVDLRHYEAVGGMQEALSRHADEVLASLPSEDDRRVAERMFKALTEKGPDGRGIRRPTRMQALCDIVETDQTAIERVIDAYRRPGVTFLMPGREVELRDRTVIDLSHESLMRIWERLRGWVDAESQSVRIFQRLADTARLWKLGRAGLYHDPDLQIARTWRDETRPNATWACQYGGGFEEAMEFLEESREAAEAEERRREEARKKELAQARALAATQEAAARNFKRFSVGMGVVALLAIVAMLYALRAHHDAEEARTEVARSLSLSDLIRGTEMVERSDSLRGLGFLLRSHELDERLDAPLQAAYNALRGRPAPTPVLDLVTGDASTLCTAVEGNLLATGDRSGVVRIHDLETGAVLEELEHSSSVVALDLCDDGRLLAVGTGSGLGHVWEWKERKKIASRDYPAWPRISQVALIGPGTHLMAELNFPVGRWLALLELESDAIRFQRTITGNPDGFPSFRLLPQGEPPYLVTQTTATGITRLNTDLQSGQVQLFPDSVPESDDPEGESTPEAPVTAFGVSPDGGLLAVATAEGVVLKRLEPATGGTLLLRGSGSVVDIRFSRDSSRVVTSSEDGTARIHSVSDGEELATFDHPAPVREAWFSPDGLRLLTVSVDSLARIWNAETGEPLAESFTHLGPYGRDPFVGDGFRVLVRQGDQRLRLLDAVPIPGLAVTLRHPSGIRDVTISPDAALAATAAEDGLLRLWRVGEGLDHSILRSEGAVLTVEFSPDGTRLLSVSEDGVARIRDAATGTELIRLDPPQPVLEACYSQDGSSIITRMDFGAVQVWDGGTGEARCPPWRLESPVVSAALSSDGRLVAAATEDGLIVAREVETGREVYRTEETVGLVRSLEFEPGTNRLAFVSGDGSLHVARAAPGEDVTLTITHGILDIAWGPEGGILLARCGDHSTRLWDASTGEPVGSPMDHKRPVSLACFSPDGRLVATASGDEAHVWDVLTGQPLVASLGQGSGTITTVRFDPRGLRLFTGGDDGLLCIHDVAFSSSNGASSGVVALAGAIVEDQRLDRDASNGASLDKLREESLRGDSGGLSSGIARWYFSNPGERTLSPGSQVGLASWMDSAFERGDLESGRWSVLLEPHDPLRRAQLAVLRLEESRSRRARFHSRLDLEEALRTGADDPEVGFLVGAAQALLGDEAEAERWFARAGAHQEPSLETMLTRIRLLGRLGIPSSSDASRKMQRELLDQAIEMAAREGGDGESLVTDLRARRLDLLLEGGEYREARRDWSALREDPDLEDDRREEIFTRLLAAARVEWDRLEPSERREQAMAFVAPLLLRWLLPIHDGDLSSRWQYGQYLLGLPETEVPRRRLIARRSVWKYRDDGADLGREWRQPEYDDSSWKSGPGRLGFPQSNGREIRETRLERYRPHGSQILTYYFRHSFELEGLPAATALLFEVLHDDGVIVYLNGKQVLRQNMDPGPVDAGTTASTAVGGVNETRYRIYNRSQGPLRKGTNVLAAEVHQCNDTSSDIGFDLQLDVGLRPREYLAGFSLELWEVVIEDMLSLLPSTADKGLRDAVRIALLPEVFGEATKATAGAWLTRAHIQEVFFRLQQAFDAVKRAATLALADVEAAPRDPVAAALLRRSLDARDGVVERMGWGSRQITEEPVYPALPEVRGGKFQLVDLREVYNASRFERESWHSADAPARLDELPVLVRSLGGVPFHAAGIIQLNSGVYPEGSGNIGGSDINGEWGKEYPDAVTIPVERKVTAAHFLVSTIYGRMETGTEETQSGEERGWHPAARYVFHYTDGTEVEEPLLWGRDVCDWVQTQDLRDLGSLAWRGEEASLQEKSWTNPHPEKVLSRIELISEKVTAAPFLMAVTVESVD